MTHLINYTSEFSEQIWTQITVKTNPNPSQLTTEYKFEKLDFANAWYDIRVSIQVEDTLYGSVWSNFTPITFRTLSRRPDDPPNVDQSGFSVDPSGNIYLYWMEIPNSKKNGYNPTYNITIQSGAPS